MKRIQEYGEIIFLLQKYHTTYKINSRTSKNVKKLAPKNNPNWPPFNPKF